MGSTVQEFMEESYSIPCGYYEKNPSTQSTVQFNKLGQTASHGCIRLSVGDAKWIYDNCALGTKLLYIAAVIRDL